MEEIILSKKIKELRKDFKMTQNDLAQKIGVTQSTIVAYENGSSFPTFEGLIKLSQIFNEVSIEILIFGKMQSINLDDLDAYQKGIQHGMIQNKLAYEMQIEQYINEIKELESQAKLYKNLLEEANRQKFEYKQKFEACEDRLSSFKNGGVGF